MIGSILIDTKQVTHVTHVKKRLFNHSHSVLSLGFWLLVCMFRWDVFLLLLSRSFSLSVSSFHLDAVDYEDMLLSGVRVWTYIVVVLLQYLYKFIFFFFLNTSTSAVAYRFNPTASLYVG